MTPRKQPEPPRQLLAQLPPEFPQDYLAALRRAEKVLAKLRIPPLLRKKLSPAIAQAILDAVEDSHRRVAEFRADEEPPTNPQMPLL